MEIPVGNGGLAKDSSRSVTDLGAPGERCATMARAGIMTAVKISEFLMARIADDEIAVDLAGVFGHPEEGPILIADAALQRIEYNEMVIGPRRILLELEAKRHIVDLHTGTHECAGAGPGGQHGTASESDPCPTLRALASVHADHPEFNHAWLA